MIHKPYNKVSKVLIKEEEIKKPKITLKKIFKNLKLRLKKKSK